MAADVGRYHTSMPKLEYFVILQNKNFCKRSTFQEKHQIIPRSLKESFSGNSVKIYDCRAFLIHSRPCPAVGHIGTKKKCIAAGAPGIGETRNSVQLNGFFGKIIPLYNLFSQSATLPAYLFICFFICQSTFFILLFFSAEYFFKKF